MIAIACVGRANKNATNLVRRVEEIGPSATWQVRARVFRTESIDFTPVTQLTKLNLTIASTGRPPVADARVEVPAGFRKPAFQEEFWVANAVMFSSGLIETGDVTRVRFSTAELDPDGLGDDYDTAPVRREDARPVTQARRPSARRQETELSDDQ